MISVSSSRREIRRHRIESVRASDMNNLCSELELGSDVTVEGEKDVVERGRLHREALDFDAIRIDLVEQHPDLGGAAVGRDRKGEILTIVLSGALAKELRYRPEPSGVSELEQKTPAGDPLLESIRGALCNDPAAVNDGDLIGEPVGLLQVLSGQQYRDTAAGHVGNNV